MGKDLLMQPVEVTSLKHLDALIGFYLTGEEPHVHWEDSSVHMRFDTVEEALDAFQDRYFQQFIPEHARRNTILSEVHVYRRYSTELEAAWTLVEMVGALGHPLHMQFEQSRWVASFGEQSAISAESAPLAISLAALRIRGIEVAFHPRPETAPEFEEMHYSQFA
jgi:hypothetical protein